MLKLAALGFVFIALQNPVPSRGEDQRQPDSQHPQAEQSQSKDRPEDVRGTPKSPVVVQVLPIPTSPDQAANDQDKRLREATTEGWTIGLTAALVAATIGLIVVGWYQWRALKDHAIEIKAQAGLMSEQKRHNLIVERAYVSLSHLPPGLELDTVQTTSGDGIARSAVRLDIRLQNNGHTPARITRVLLRPFFGASLPADPQYNEGEYGEARGGFIASTGSVVIGQEWLLPSERLTQIKSVGNLMRDEEPLKLWIIGYVDYIDQFDVRHRSGYARIYDPRIDSRRDYNKRGFFASGDIAMGRAFDQEAFDGRNNLLFVGLHTYDYDRPRLRGEGNDWEDQKAN